MQRLLDWPFHPFGTRWDCGDLATQAAERQWRLLQKKGRAIDRGLPGIGYGIPACIVMIATIMAWPIVEWAIYAGGLIRVVGGLVAFPFLLLWAVWKRRTRGANVD